MQTQVQTRHIKKQFNHFTMKFETETRAAFICPHCDGLVSYIKLPKLKTCQHCGYELDWQTLGTETKPKPKADPVRPQAHPTKEGRKTCTRCKQTFEASTVNFYRNSRSPDGLYAQCKACRNKTMNRYYQKRKERRD